VETAGTKPGLRGSPIINNEAATRIQAGQEQQLQGLLQRGISEKGLDFDQQVGQGVQVARRIKVQELLAYLTTFVTWRGQAVQDVVIVKAPPLDATQGLALAWLNRSLAFAPASLTAVLLLDRLAGLAVPKEIVSYRGPVALGASRGVEAVKVLPEGDPQFHAVAQESGGGVKFPAFRQIQLSPHEQSQDGVKVGRDDLAPGCGNLGHKGGTLAERLKDDLAW
jgi:hypothetical protein